MMTGVEKLTITPFAKKGDRYERLSPIVALFNPESYAISKSVTWSAPTTALGTSARTQRQVNAPILSFGGGGSRQMSLELFFDVTLPVERNGRQVQIEDVREETNKIVALTRIQRDEEQPRVCEIAWGKAPIDSDLPFIGVITGLSQKFTQFRPGGQPVRANLSLTLTEFLDPKLDKLKTDPELTPHIVTGGDTLSRIAGEYYRDPRLWRAIADANALDDPRDLKTGQRLTIPKLR
ncbi:MAG: hypothetical protein N5P05_004396 (plasmid) [Chroococcopsis gigantea SAG 12.99]|jgi:nucleoid-associated protein YgaU|nr:hypothetical protein [Chroococcopsis gigantea SAG 12.99]